MVTKTAKGASSSTPKGAEMDPKVGLILAASLPVAAIVFWNITIPFAFHSVSFVLGNELIQKMSFLSQDVWGLMTSPCPPWISAEDKAFLNDQSFHQINRVSQLSKDSFTELFKEGKPFIVTDVMKDWKTKEQWNCRTFAEQYPDADFFNWQDQTTIKLKDFSLQPNMECSRGLIMVDSEANQRYAKDWVSSMPAPYFMDSSFFTSQGDIPVFMGHIGTPGTGITPHVEESCASHMIVQFSGVQHWSLSWPEKEDNHLQWQKPVRFYLQPGEALFFPFGARQSTETVDGCSLSFNFKLKSPAPEKHIKQLKEMLHISQKQVEQLLSTARVENFKFLEDCIPNEDKD